MKEECFTAEVAETTEERRTGWDSEKERLGWVGHQVAMEDRFLVAPGMTGL